MVCWRLQRWSNARGRRRVGTLALTDHDTTAGLAEARAACAASQIRFVPGVELSAQWRGQTIHIVGLQVDESHAGFKSHLDAVLRRRQERLREIGERLEKRARLPGRELAALAAQATAPTRLHLARLLVERGHARDTQEAFDRWLNRDKAGHVPAEWPALAAAMAVLRDSGAIARARASASLSSVLRPAARADRGIRAGGWRRARSQHGRHESQ